MSEMNNSVADHHHQQQQHQQQCNNKSNLVDNVEQSISNNCNISNGSIGNNKKQFNLESVKNVTQPILSTGTATAAGTTTTLTTTATGIGSTAMSIGNCNRCRCALTSDNGIDTIRRLNKATQTVVTAMKSINGKIAGAGQVAVSVSLSTSANSATNSNTATATTTTGNLDLSSASFQEIEQF